MSGDPKSRGNSAQAALGILERKRNHELSGLDEQPDSAVGPSGLKRHPAPPPKKEKHPVDRRPLLAFVGVATIITLAVALYACSCTEVPVGSHEIKPGAVQKWRYVFRSNPHRMRIVDEPRGRNSGATCMEGPVDSDGEFHGLILSVFKKGDAVWVRYEHGQRQFGGPGDNRPAGNFAGRDL